MTIAHVTLCISWYTCMLQWVTLPYLLELLHPLRSITGWPPCLCSNLHVPLSHALTQIFQQRGSLSVGQILLNAFHAKTNIKVWHFSWNARKPISQSKLSQWESFWVPVQKRSYINVSLALHSFSWRPRSILSFLTRCRIGSCMLLRGWSLEP